MADPNPLAEASPASLDELFSRDPLDLSRAERDQIVAEFRRMRETWNKAELAGAKRGAKPPKGSVEVSAEDLGI